MNIVGQLKIVGHRGARGLAPENTLVSLQKALEHHADEVEFDLRVTKDNIVILHHDLDVVDQSGRRLSITHSTFQELQQHKPDLATLEMVLQTLNPAAHLHLEVKPGEPTTPIIKILKQHLTDGWKTSRLSLASKSHKILLELHEALPDIPKVVIHPWSGTIATRRARQVNTKLISMNQRWLWRGFIKPMAKRGWQLYAYTLNDPKKAKRWATYGLAGVITDYPDRFDPRK